MILLIIGAIFIISGIILLCLSCRIKLKRNQEQENYDISLKNEIQQLQDKREELLNSQLNKKKQLNKELLEWQNQRKQEIDEYIKSQQELAKSSVKSVQQKTQKQITEIHQDLSNIRQSAIQQKQQINFELDKLKASLSAGVEARLREQQKKEKINFYKLYIEDADLSDVKMLENLKVSFHKPVVLSKLIWSQYFQKQMTQLCDRVLGKKVICGIYKITNLLTEQCYIGQSVNISDRWKQHCKCGLGIQASATNTLYKSMQRDKIWNFSFELLEECPRDQLNEKEKYWIQMYQSNKFGLNTTKGNL